MSILTDITDLTQRVATEFNLFNLKRGDLANLTTTDKSNLVSALNELKSTIGAFDATYVISDGLSTSLNRTWSIDKLKNYLSIQISNLVDGADDGLNTLKEIGDALIALQTVTDTKVSYEVQVLTELQKTQARANIGVGTESDFTALELVVNNLIIDLGDLDHDFVSDFDIEINS